MAFPPLRRYVLPEGVDICFDNKPGLAWQSHLYGLTLTIITYPLCDYVFEQNKEFKLNLSNKCLNN